MSVSETFYQRNSQIPWQHLGDEAILLNPGRQQAHEMNEIGKDIWIMLETTQTISSIVSELRKNYQISDEQNVHLDLQEYLQDLIAKGLVQCQS